jgi:hypothetical protein
MAGGRSPVTTGKQPASKSGSCVMPSQPGPELTVNRNIKVNLRVSLRDRAGSVRSSHRRPTSGSIMAQPSVEHIPADGFA